MGIFSSNKKENKLVAMFGIGSGSVGGSLVNFTKDQHGFWLPHIITQARTHIDLKEELDFDTFFKDMQKTLVTTAQKIYDMKKGAPDEIYCTLNSPWYTSETRTIHLEKSTPFMITKKIVDEMIQKELKNVSDKYSKKYEGVYTKPILLEGKVLHSSLNGYGVDDPIGKRATSIDLNIFISISPEACIKGIEESLKKVFHNTKISYGSFISSLFIAARDRYITVPSYLLIDINAEITDVAIVSNGVLSAMMSFPMGKNSVIRSLSSKLNKSEDESRSLFRMHATKMLTAEEKARVDDVLQYIHTEWVKLFRDAIISLPRSISLPTSVFLVGDDDTTVWFKEVLESGDYSQDIVTDKKFRVITVEGPLLLDMCKVSDGTCDQFLMVEAIAMARILPL